MIDRHTFQPWIATRLGRGKANVVQFFALCLLPFALAACLAPAPYTPHGKVYEEPAPAPALNLTDHTGQAFDLAEHHGKVVLLFFGYTHCPDICPTALSDLARVRRELGRDADQLQVVFVSVDPERDTQRVLGHYVPAFDPSFIGLRGDPEQVAAAIAAYRVKVVRRELPESALGYAMDHSTYVFVIDRDGLLRQRLIHGVETTDAIVSDVRALLR